MVYWQSFLFDILENVVAMVGVAIAVPIVDSAEKQRNLLTGGTLMRVFMLILRGMGTPDANTLWQHGRDAVVASLVLFQFYFHEFAEWCCLRCRQTDMVCEHRRWMRLNPWVRMLAFE